MNRKEIASGIYAASHITGTFVLRSGQTSREYFDKYLFEADPALLRAIAGEMRALIPGDTEVLAGLEMGGIPVVTALSMETGLPASFVRKRAKAYGTCKLAEGSEVRGKRVCIVEDIVTTGGQIIESVGALRERGAIVDTVLCVVLRDEAACDILAAEALTLKPAFTMAYIKEAAGAP